MKELKTIQNNLKKRSNEMDCPPYVKLWPWKKIWPKENFQACDVGEFKKAIKNVKELEKQGIKFTNFKNATAGIKNKIKNIFKKGEGLNMLELAMHAKTSEIFVINIPAKTNAKIIFKNGMFAHWASLVINIGENSKLTMCDGHKVTKDYFNAANIYAIAQKKSECEYLIKANKRPAYAFYYNAILDQGAKFHWILQEKMINSYYHQTIKIDHEKSKSEGNITAAVDLGQGTNLLLNLGSNHDGKDTKGDIALKSLGRKEAKGKIDGFIKIGEKAFNTDSYLKQDVLLLSDSSEIEAQPNLEILNNDVRASHGATLGLIDKEQMFYLMSRGLTKKQAEKIITSGFLQTLRDRIKTKELKQEFL